MNWRNITTVYLKELKDSLRDRRTLISVIVVPTIVMPLMFLIVGKVTASSVPSGEKAGALLLPLKLATCRRCPVATSCNQIAAFCCSKLT